MSLSTFSISALDQNEYRFHTLLREIVISYPFLYKKDPTQEMN